MPSSRSAFLAPPRSSGSRLPIAIAASVAIHAALLAASPALRMDRNARSELLRVSFLGSSARPGGRPGGGGTDGGERPAPARIEPASAPSIAEARAAKPVSAPKSVRARAKPRPRPAEVASAPPPALEDTRAASGVPDGIGTAPSSNGAGSSSGEGAGTAAGHGTGKGAGSGKGEGGDLRVACEYCPTPRYPRTAVARKVEGVVQVDFTLTADGRVSDVQVRNSSGDRDLDRAAMDVARRSRFRLGAPLADAARGYLEYEFQLGRRGNT